VRQAAIALLVLGGIALVAGEHAMPAAPGTSEFLYTVAKRYEPLAWMKGEDRFPSGAAIFIHDAKGGHSLVPSFAASADTAVSFDGRNVLFAGKSTSQDHWQIWEVPLAGGDPRRITNCAQDCLRPFYLPDNSIVYAEKLDGRFVIQNVDLAGSKPLSLTYGFENSLPTDVLRDGRVLFEAAYAPRGTPELYTVYPDGSGVESYRCDHGAPRFAGRQVHSGDIVFAQEHGMGRFTSALAKEVRIETPPGDYAGDLAETSTGEWLLPWRPRGNGDFRLMWWKPGQSTLRPAVEERGASVIQPMLVGESVVPKRYPSGLHDWQVANLLCLNAYTSKYKFAAESIHAVRLYTRDAAGGAQLLGTAPVESDGSFYVQVPGDAPLQIELLDGSGKSLKREAGWFWMRKGEQRVCVGCHAGPETAPENAVPMVLEKSTTPADMTHATAANSVGGH
jgi:hypothetical protein